MEIKIIAFGQIAEITGREFIMPAEDISSLKTNLLQRFPELSGKKIAFAVNKKTVQDNQVLNNSDVVALMPPYSGG